MGRAQVPANSPIKIKKHVRAPGNRAMLKSFHKMEGNTIRMVNEFRSSRLCGRCYSPFPLSTLSHRFKVCDWCWPDNEEWPDGLKLPTKIVTMKSSRELKSQRRAIRRAMVEDRHGAVGFVSKVKVYRKNWQQNAANAAINTNAEYDDGAPVLKTIWHRDISAAKLILYRGTLFIQLKFSFENWNEIKMIQVLY